MMTLQQSPHKNILEDYLNDAKKAKTLTLSNKVVSSDPLEESTAMPLSFLQDEVWLNNQSHPNDTSYNIYSGLYLQGDLNIDILHRSLNEVLQRYSILRSYFVEEKGQAVQKVRTRLTLALTFFDFSQLSEQQKQTKINNDFIYEENTPFDFHSPPLLRASLLCLAQDSYLLSITFHHMIYDASSTEILIGELTALYDAFIHNQPSPLTVVNDHYADYSKWQKQYFTPKMLQKRKTYWENLLHNAPPPLQLPTDKESIATQKRNVYQSGLERFELSATASKTLCQFGSENSAPAPIVLLALYVAMLHQYSGQHEMMIGLPVNRRKFLKRRAPQFMNLWGYFSGISVLHIQLDENPTFLHILKKVRRAMMNTLRNQDLTLKQVWNSLGLKWTEKQQQLFRTVFHFVPIFSRDSVQLSEGLTLSSLPNRRGVMVRDLVIAIWAKEGVKNEFEGAFRYRQDMFSQEKITEIITRLQTLLETIAADPEQPIQAFNTTK